MLFAGFWLGLYGSTSSGSGFTRKEGEHLQKLTLRALRVNYSLSAKTVASDLGIHYQTLLKYEQDSRKIPMDLLQKLASYYKVEVDVIFLGRKYDLIQKLS